MQDWQGQANKNGLEIRETGKCQLCGSHTSHGISECFQMAAQITQLIEHQSGIMNRTLFLCVDAHALQHPEARGRWNNHFHLTRLWLILAKEVPWNYKLSPLLSETLDAYKIGNMDERIQAPGLMERGHVTVSDVQGAASEKEYIERVWQWARSVYQAYKGGHEVAGRVADLFLRKNSSVTGSTGPK